MSLLVKLLTFDYITEGLAERRLLRIENESGKKTIFVKDATDAGTFKCFLLLE